MKTKSKTKQPQRPKATGSRTNGVNTTERVIREYEIIKSDRIELINQAVRVVGMIIARQTMPLMRCDYPVDEPILDDSERLARDAALAFLVRQFEQGYSLPETVERKVELHYDAKRS